MPRIRRGTPLREPCQNFARNYAIRDLAPHHNTTPTVPLACAVVLERQVLRGGMNHRRTDGKGWVVGSMRRSLDILWWC